MTEHHAIVVISLRLPDADEIVTVLEHIDPPHVPHFSGQVRIAVDPHATAVVDYLEGLIDDLPVASKGSSPEVTLCTGCPQAERVTPRSDP